MIPGEPGKESPMPTLTIDPEARTAIAQFDDDGPVDPATGNLAEPVLSSDTPEVLTVGIAATTGAGRWTAALEAHGAGVARVMWEPMVGTNGDDVTVACGHEPPCDDDARDPFQPPPPLSVRSELLGDGSFQLSVNE